MPNNFRNESKKEITIQDRIKLIRKIHILKLADKIDVSDVRKDPKQQSISEIFSEKECWKCGKIGKKELCPECREEIRNNCRLVKPEIKEEFIVDIESLLVTLLTNTSLFTIFTRDAILGTYTSDWMYMQSFMKYSRNMINGGLIEKIVIRGAVSYKLTSDGIRHFTSKVENVK